MDQKQYEVMSLIMAKGRKFLDEIYKMMSETGLLDQKYEVELEIKNYESIDIGCKYLLSVEVMKARQFDETDDAYSKRLEQWNKDGKGWEFWNDPLGKSGPVPEDDGIPQGFDLNGAESGVYPAGEASESNAPLNNGVMWFHDDGGDPPMVCRGDLNGMAESESGC